MQKFVLIIFILIPLDIVCGRSSLLPEESICPIKLDRDQSYRHDRNIKLYENRDFKLKIKKKFLVKYNSKKWVLALGFLMSILSVSFLVFLGTGGQLIGLPFLFGFFGALLCFLTISNETNKSMSIIGSIIGIIGALGSVISIIYRSS